MHRNPVAANEYQGESDLNSRINWSDFGTLDFFQNSILPILGLKRLFLKITFNTGHFTIPTENYCFPTQNLCLPSTEFFVFLPKIVAIQPTSKSFCRKSSPFDPKIIVLLRIFVFWPKSLSSYPESLTSDQNLCLPAENLWLSTENHCLLKSNHCLPPKIIVFLPKIFVFWPKSLSSCRESLTSDQNLWLLLARIFYFRPKIIVFRR